MGKAIVTKLLKVRGSNSNLILQLHPTISLPNHLITAASSKLFFRVIYLVATKQSDLIE